MVRLHMGGKAFKMANLPEDVQKAIKNRLAQKDPNLAAAMKGVLPGIKINGEPVTQELVDSLEIKPGEKVKAKKKPTLLSKVKDSKVIKKVEKQIKKKVKKKKVKK